MIKINLDRPERKGVKLDIRILDTGKAIKGMTHWGGVIRKIGIVIGLVLLLAAAGLFVAGKSESNGEKAKRYRVAAAACFQTGITVGLIVTVLGTMLMLGGRKVVEVLRTIAESPEFEKAVAQDPQSAEVRQALIKKLPEMEKIVEGSSDAGGWKCPCCGGRNAKTAANCGSCGSRRPGLE